MVYNKLTCLFGYHDYSGEITKDHNGYPVCLCKICKRSGYRKWKNNLEAWYNYDKEGNHIHTKWSDGDEFWFDDEENLIHKKYFNGCELWKVNYGRWVTKKPKNWKHEKDL